MKKGFAFLVILVFIGILVVIGGISYVVARNFTESDQPRKFEFLGGKRSTSQSKIQQPPTQTPKATITPSPPFILPSPTSTSSSTAPIAYRQPQGKYTIVLPDDWIVNSTTATNTYSTTKFTGPNGNISITFGSGKNPIGGCSETTNIELFDRTISGCFLLQKDGSQLLTRVYTKDKAGLDFTIEAYINSPLSANRPIVLNIIKAIDIE